MLCTCSVSNCFMKLIKNKNGWKKKLNRSDIMLLDSRTDQLFILVSITFIEIDYRH